MRNLNPDQLRSLVEVVTQGNFSAAARRLNLTQPAISLHIRELEKRCGVRLVERVGTAAHPTVPGQELVERARRILEECAAADAAMRRYREGWLGRVRLSTTLTGLMYRLPPVLAWLATTHPDIELLVTNMPTRDTVDGILANNVDLGLVTLPVADRRLLITPLRPEMLVAILPAAARDVPAEITPDYVANQSLVLEHARGAVHALVLEWLAARMPLKRTPMHCGTVEAMKKIVASGLGMSIVPDVSVAEPEPEIIVRPLKPAMRCTLALAQHRSKPNDPAFEIVRDAVLTLKAM